MVSFNGYYVCNGHGMIIWPWCVVGYGLLVMVWLLCVTSLCVKTLWIYKGKEVKRVYVRGDGAYSAGQYSGSCSRGYSGGGFS